MIDITHILWWDRPEKAILHSYSRYPMKKADKLRAISHGLSCFEHNYNLGMELKLMAKKGKGSQGRGFTTQFAAIRLDERMKDEFQHWLGENGKDVENFIAIAQGDGWKMSSRWDNENDCYICSLTMVDEDDRNYDVCVVNRSDNFFEAFMIGYYKVYILNDKKKLPTERPKENWG